jgi:sugar phosphate isomerase/epimerase
MAGVVPHGPAVGFGDLVLCSGTVITATFAEQVAAAAAAGFAGVSVWPRRVLDALDRSGSIGALRRMSDDHGVQVVDLDAVMDWIDHPDFHFPPHLPADEIVPKEQFLELAAGLGARGVNAADLSGLTLRPDEYAESFATLCDLAAPYGLLVYLEFFNASSINSLAAAAEIARLADRPNGGVLLDTWHYQRGPSAADNDVARFADDVLMLQVSDATPEPGPDWWDETMNGRLLPGEGAIDLGRVLGAARAAKGSAPIGVEVFSARLAALPPVEAARLAADAMRAVLSRLPDA